jgi:GNAT superfamily N-acetyltransferase
MGGRRRVPAEVELAAHRGGATPVAVEVTFLRMDRPPEGPRPASPPGAQVVVAERCTVGFYRYLYDGVGRRHVWWLRRTLTDEQLSGILDDPTNSVHVLMHHGEPAGFYELDRRNRPVVKLSYFGLLPHALGRGMGRALLRHAVEAAWAGGGIRAVTVNTCTADHPRALPNYLAAGFRPVRAVREVWQVPMRLGLPIPERLKAG